MAIAFIESAAVFNEYSEVATSAIDTSGADLLVVMYLALNGAPATITDSKSNTWTDEGPISVSSGYYDLWASYCLSPTVGSGHTFSMTGGGSSTQAVAAFSGATGGFDDLVGGESTSNTVQPGSLTPAANGAVLLTYLLGFGDATATLSINSGFTEAEEVVVSNNAVGLSYKIQSTAGAENPTYTGTGWTSTFLFASMAAFLPSAGGGQIPRSNRMQQLLVR